jgi:hypothetical protein
MSPEKGRKTNLSRTMPNKPIAITEINIASQGFIPTEVAKIKQI